jgi:hypothetical protein
MQRTLKKRKKQINKNDETGVEMGAARGGSPASFWLRILDLKKRILQNRGQLK